MMWELRLSVVSPELLFLKSLMASRLTSIWTVVFYHVIPLSLCGTSNSSQLQ